MKWQPDEYLRVLIDEYRVLRNNNMSHYRASKEAKAFVNELYPKEAEMLRKSGMARFYPGSETDVDNEFYTQYTSVLAALKKEYDNEPVTISETKPQSTNEPDITYQPRSDVLGYIESLDPNIGQEIVFNFHFLKWKYGKANASAYMQAFDKGANLDRAGWKTEVTKRDSKEFRVRITGKPMVNNQLEELDELKRIMADINEKIRVLSNGRGKH